MSKGKHIGPERRRSAQAWSFVIQDWRRSRQIAREFCQARGISLRTFHWWRWALAAHGGRPAHRTDGRPSDGPSRSAVASTQTSQLQVPAFIEVVPRPSTPAAMPSSQKASGVEVVLVGDHGERRIRIAAGFDMVTLRQVVSVLEEV